MRLVAALKAVAASLLLGSLINGAQANPVSTTLFYTTFAGGQNVWRTPFSYDGSGVAGGVTYAPSVNIASTVGADGIVFNPQNSHLLVGGQGPRIHDVPVTGAPIITQATPGVNVFHLSVDPSLNFVYGTNIPGATVAKVGLAPGGFSGSVTNLGVLTAAGGPSNVTSLAFDTLGNAFYTNASPAGAGQFGTATIGPATVTTNALQILTAAHGMIFDPFTGWLTLFGDNQIAQIDPANPGVLVASRVLPNVDFDQGTSDGAGHLWIASNNGNVTFIDLTSCTGGEVDEANCFIDTRFLKANLDDLAPLTGPGGCAPNCPTVPEPNVLALFALAFFGLVAGRRTRWSSRSARA